MRTTSKRFSLEPFSSSESGSTPRRKKKKKMAGLMAPPLTRQGVSNFPRLEQI